MDTKHNVFAAKFSPYGQLLATSYADGSLRIHSAAHGETLHTLKVPHLTKSKRPECDVEQGKEPMMDDESSSPHANCFVIDADHSITAIAWKPDGKSDDSFSAIPTAKNPLALRAATSDGRILRWNFDKPEELVEDIFSESNYYHTLDYSYDGGAKFACAGFEPVVEIYDEETLQRVQFFDKVDRIGHSNKIYCVKFDHRHPSVLYSGGWDRNVNLWDMRAGGKQGQGWSSIANEIVFLK